MINSVSIKSYKGQRKTLRLSELSEEGIFIKKITGLGPVKAQVNLTDVAGYDGSEFNSSQLEERNIQIIFGFEEAYSNSVEDARQLLYKLFTTKREVRLDFDTTNRKVYCTGIVETNEPNIFDKNVTESVTIRCADPYFYDTANNGVQQTVFFGTEDQFEFPFSNESLTENLIEFGVVRRNAQGNVYYKGEVETGCKIYIHAVGSVGSITIYNTQTRERMIIDADKLASKTGSSLKTADTLIIDTNRGHKNVQLLRDGVYTNVLSILKKGSDWFKIEQGDNLFAYTATSGIENVQFTIENKVAYGGI